MVKSVYRAMPIATGERFSFWKPVVLGMPIVDLDRFIPLLMDACGGGCS
jgi:hypothetical protein